jgi:hypothetical protein
MSGSEVPAEKDIELVLVTGAGATREFGLHGTKVPMMAEWSRALVEKLRSVSGAYLAAAGLAEGLDGPEFERRLGRFLRQVPAFAQISGMLKPSLSFQETGQVIAEQPLLRWHARTMLHLSEISDLVQESLYEGFSAERIDLAAASHAYARLLSDLRIGTADSLVYATTNYDPAGEYALEQSGRIPDWGAPRQVLNFGPSPLHVESILDGLPRYVPVLHLHGRVDWHRRQDDGMPRSADAARRDPGCGVPIASPPDPDHAYGSDPVIQLLWDQFERALRRARRVFVLGHSLSHRALVESLRRNVSPAHRLAVGILASNDDPGEVDQSAASTISMLRNRLPGAGLITVRFGPDPAISAQGVQAWTERARKGT